MRKITAAVIMVGALLAGCATSAPGPSAAPNQVAVDPTASLAHPT
jgi:nitrous oxide reductase accessory protein NosL